jgi:membrane dipeptidase
MHPARGTESAFAMVQYDVKSSAPFIWDMHGCPSRTRGNDLTSTLERYKRAGFDCVTVNVSDADYRLEDAITTIASFRKQIADRPERYILVDTVADLYAARPTGRLAVSFDVEGVVSIGESLDLVDLYYDLGVRWMAFVYNRSNLAGFGCHDERDGGLTPFGRRLVERMERVGIIKCCSHAGYRTALDVFVAGGKPTILSHSNPRSLVDHERNVPDEVLKACAETGGVVGINGVNLFLGSDKPSARDVFRHVDYVVQLIGDDHVGIALDTVFPRSEGEETDFVQSRRPDLWPPDQGYPATFLGPEILGEMVTLMNDAGYSAPAIARILGGNFARVATECWRR